MFNKIRKLPSVVLLFVATLANPAVAEESAPKADPLSQIRAEHVMISTDDYDATMAWYQDKLGFNVRKEWTVPEFPGVKLAYMTFAPVFVNYMKALASWAGLDEGEALSFLFEHFDSVTNQENLTARLRLFNAELDARKK